MWHRGIGTVGGFTAAALIACMLCCVAWHTMPCGAVPACLPMYPDDGAFGAGTGQQGPVMVPSTDLQGCLRRGGGGHKSCVRGGPKKQTKVSPTYIVHKLKLYHAPLVCNAEWGMRAGV